MSETTIRDLQNAMTEILMEVDKICTRHNIKYVLALGSALGAVRHKGFIPWDDDLDIILLREDYVRFLEAANQEIDHERFFVQKEFSEHWPMCYSKVRLNNTAYIEYKLRDKNTHQGIFIDIFPCDNLSDSIIMQKIQFYASRIMVAQGLKKKGYPEEKKNFKKKFLLAVCGFIPQNAVRNICERRKASNSNLIHTFCGAVTMSKNIFPRSLFDEIVCVPFEGRDFPIFAQYDSYLKTVYGNYMQIPPESERMAAAHAISYDTNRSYEEYLN